MSEINMDFSFPAAPASAPSATSVLAPPFSHHQQRPLSFSPQSRPRKHAHRRSAAMSEDLKATDLSVLTAPQLAATPVGPASSPSSISVRSTASATSNASDTNSVMFAPLPSPKVPQMPAVAAESSRIRRNSFEARGAGGSRVQFVSSPSPVSPVRRLANLGEPGQLVPASPTTSPSPLPSPREEGSRRRTTDRTKRRSFVRVFRRSRDFDASGGDETLTVHDMSDAAALRLTSPAPNLSPQSPEMSSSPILTPRNSGELLRDLEPEPPQIDLDEALSCSFEHRRPDGILDSPFSKASSTIGPVLEEEEESEADSLASGSRPPSTVALHKRDSVHSVSSSTYGRHSAIVPSLRQTSTTPILLSPPIAEKHAHAAVATRALSPGSRDPDQLSHLAIIDPKPASKKPAESARHTKSHARRRSFISRIRGRSN